MSLILSASSAVRAFASSFFLLFPSALADLESMRNEDWSDAELGEAEYVAQFALDTEGVVFDFVGERSLDIPRAARLDGEGSFEEE